VLPPPLEGPEDEHVERALEELQAPVVGRLGHSRRQSTALDVECLRLVPAFASTAKRRLSRRSASARRRTPLIGASARRQRREKQGGQQREDYLHASSDSRKGA